MELNFETIQKLISEMQEAGLTSIKVKAGDDEVVLEKGHVAAPAVAVPSAPVAIAAQEVQAPAVEPEGASITSPMVGTYYGTPSPEAEPFVKVGDRVSEGTVVCIIEAMKVMNEVKAGTSGVIKEVLVESGHPVEFGTKLFRIG